jgi:hypothetical protein
VVGIPYAIRRATLDQSMGVPPPPRLWGHAFAGGSVLAFGGVLLLSYGAYGWAALFLVLGALNLGGGIWYLTVARSESGPKLSPRDPGTRALPLAPDRHAQA